MPCVYEECQFTVPENELIDFDGREWCVFHLPMDSEAGETSPKKGYDEYQVDDFNRLVLGVVDRVDRGNFGGVVFPGNIDFEGRTFSGPTSFQSASFSGDAYFKNARFSGAASFQSASFSGDALFSEASFSGDAYFKNARFSGDASFQSASFSGDTFFSEASFSGYAYFDNATYAGHAFFGMASFFAAARFVDANFCQTADFHQASFSASAMFHQATFTGDVDFLGARFSGSAVFSDADFRGAASFSMVAFSGEANFETRDTDSVGVHQALKGFDFRSSRVWGHARFTNRRFTTPADFEDTIFDRAPEFHGCEIHQGSRFPGIDSYRDTTSGHAAQAYRTLKLAMEQNRSRAEEAMFYALEQMSLRHSRIMGQDERVLSWLYEKTAGYGQSILRPLVSLGVVTLGFTILYSLWAYMTDSTETLGPILDPASVAGFSIKQVLSPLSLARSEGLLWNSGWHLFLLLIATLQSILSAVFVALTLLAVRWRFRRG